MYHICQEGPWGWDFGHVSAFQILPARPVIALSLYQTVIDGFLFSMFTPPDTLFTIWDCYWWFPYSLCSPLRILWNTLQMLTDEHKIVISSISTFYIFPSTFNGNDQWSLTITGHSWTGLSPTFDLDLDLEGGPLQFGIFPYFTLNNIWFNKVSDRRCNSIIFFWGWALGAT